MQRLGPFLSAKPTSVFRILPTLFVMINIALNNTEKRIHHRSTSMPPKDDRREVAPERERKREKKKNKRKKKM